ncbi:hypothetical protein V8G54_003659, partial [Vigna mungo]
MFPELRDELLTEIKLEIASVGLAIQVPPKGASHVASTKGSCPLPEELGDGADVPVYCELYVDDPHFYLVALGHNNTIIAHGATGSGKTHIIQGNAERQGLAMLAIAKFLPIAKKNGKSISVSFYEVDHQEQAMDLLNPEKSRQSWFWS